MNFFQQGKNKTVLLLIFFTLLGALLHFYQINWGNPFYFHPDERNIASAVSQLKFPNEMNPHFFAYGSLPIYVIYFTGILLNVLSGVDPSISNLLSFSEAILISRFYSALFATALIPLLFILGKKIKDSQTGILTAGLAVFSTGIIQFAHFGTFEMWLTFFSVLLFWVCLMMIKENTLKNITLAFILCGVLVSIKITSLVLIPLPFLVYGFHILNKKLSLRNIVQFAGYILYLICITITIYCISNPFVLLDTPAFLSSMKYESSAGFNTLPVFYTQGFYDTNPVVYQLLHVFPFLINPLLTLVTVFAFLFVVWKVIRSKNKTLFVLLCFFLLLFISQAFLFIKWTRYMVPTIPFIYLVVAFSLRSLQYHLNKHTYTISISLLITINCLFGTAYFITAFLHQDTRIAAYTFASQVIPKNASILSEMYDIGIIPFNNNYTNIKLFNTYDVDTKSVEFSKETWMKNISGTNYIILPSQRILQTRIQNPSKFPVGHSIYADLLKEKSGYSKIYETPCDIFCKITYLGDPIFYFEQTVSVFDRPTVMIFKKAF